MTQRTMEPRVAYAQALGCFFHPRVERGAPMKARDPERGQSLAPSQLEGQRQHLGLSHAGLDGWPKLEMQPPREAPGVSQRLAWFSLKAPLHPNRFFDPDLDFLLRVSNLATSLLSGTPEHTSYFMDSPFWRGILPSFPCSGVTWPFASRCRLSVTAAGADLWPHARQWLLLPSLQSRAAGRSFAHLPPSPLPLFFGIPTGFTQ